MNPGRIIIEFDWEKKNLSKAIKELTELGYKIIEAVPDYKGLSK